MNIELHPLCTLFPRMSGADLDALVADISANGLLSPIVLHNGMILDGGNRYRACEAAGVEPRFIEFDGDSVVQFVLSSNLHRRHLAQGQVAAITSLAQDWNRAQMRGGDRRSDQSQAVDFDSVEKRAAASGASRVTQMKADKVARESPELAKQVAHGEISLPKALEKIEPKKIRPQEESEPEAWRAKAPEPEPAQESPELIDLREKLAEMISICESQREDIDSMARVFDADDKIGAALAEAKRYREQLRIVESRVTGLQNECQEAKRYAKSLQRKLEKLERGNVAL